MSENERNITLRPSWKNYFWVTVLGILLIPAIIGIVIIWYVHKKRNAIDFIFTDRSITERNNLSEKRLNLTEIQKTEIVQTRWQKFLGIGNIHLSGRATNIVLEGISNPSVLLKQIDTVIAHEKAKAEASKSIKPETPKHDPGTLDRLDYLTGLWHQGLISDEDYDLERKKFG